MTRDEWWAMIEREWIDRRFATELEAYFQEYPGAAMMEALFNSDWGRGVRDHFGIEEFRTPPLMRQFIQRMNNLGTNDPQSVMDIERVRPETDT